MCENYHLKGQEKVALLEQMTLTERESHRPLRKDVPAGAFAQDEPGLIQANHTVAGSSLSTNEALSGPPLFLKAPTED